LISSGIAEVVAIVGSETGSVFLDVEEALRHRAQLLNLAQMGDGAAAIVLGKYVQGSKAFIDHIYFGNSGLNKESGFFLASGGSSQPYVLEGQTKGFQSEYGLTRQSGLQLFRSGYEVLRSAGYSADNVQLFLPHQANGIMGALLSPELGIA